MEFGHRSGWDLFPNLTLFLVLLKIIGEVKFGSILIIWFCLLFAPSTLKKVHTNRLLWEFILLWGKILLIICNLFNFFFFLFFILFFIFYFIFCFIYLFFVAIFLLHNRFRVYSKDKFFFENYDPLNGSGVGARPFNGWSSLIFLIMNERF